MKRHSLYDLTLGLFVAVLIISNLASTKITSVWFMVFDGGTILFPLSYIFGDVLSEVYGFSGSRRIIWSGFGALLLMAVVLYVVGIMPVAGGWNLQDAYQNILMSTPRIVFASIVAYLTGEFMNSVVLSKVKVLMGGKHLWVRTISSTLVGEFFDTLIFATIAFLGTIPTDTFIALIISNYIFKCGIEILFTPITYAVVRFYKKSEGIDTYDKGVRYNPFHVSVDR
jgi:uncharacterized integral membrane protein (TIGR00697 family)